jgi:hypothetical protein
MTALTNDPTRDLYEQRLRDHPRVCPHCGSRELLQVKPKRYAVFDDRQCKACGCQWTPAWPKTAALALLAAILAEVGGCGYLVWLFTLGEYSTWKFATEIAAGCGVLTLVALGTLRHPLRFALQALEGRAGGPRVHGIESEWLQGGAAGHGTTETIPPADLSAIAQRAKAEASAKAEPPDNAPYGEKSGRPADRSDEGGAR